MENHLSSSGIFSQDTQQCRFSNRFRWEWQFGKQDLKKLKIGSSSCLSIGPRMKIIRNVWNRKRLRKVISVGTLVFFRSWWTRKMVWNATLQTWRTVEFYCRCHGCQFSKTADIHSFRTSCALDRGFLKKKGGRCTIHFSAVLSNAEL